MIRIKRVYDPAEHADGPRFLVDRLWPRGVKKDRLVLQRWARELAPSDALRRLYHAQKIGWEEFRRRYRLELEADPKAWLPIAELALRGTVTLLTATREPTQNHTTVLREFLAEWVPESPATETYAGRRIHASTDWSSAGCRL